MEHTDAQQWSDFVMNDASDEDVNGASVWNVYHQILLFIVCCSSITGWVTETKPGQVKKVLKIE